MDAKRSLVRNWLKKARRDLLSAKRLARGSDPYLDEKEFQQAFKSVGKFHDFVCALLPIELSAP